jgi:hypothetical protein
MRRILSLCSGGFGLRVEVVEAVDDSLVVRRFASRGNLLREWQHLFNPEWAPA